MDLTFVGAAGEAAQSVVNTAACMEMCRVQSSVRGCVGFVRAKEGAQGHA